MKIRESPSVTTQLIESFLTISRQWGLATYYAYQAYGRQGYLLDITTDVWNDTYTLAMITEADAANGTHHGRNITFNGICDGTTTAGGVFFVSAGYYMQDAYLTTRR